MTSSNSVDSGICSRYWLFLSLFMLLTSTTLHAQKQLKFEVLLPQDGLLSPFLRSVVEDQNGFMWIGSQTGLQRFDGNKFKSFHHITGDPSSLSTNVISDLLVDKNNTLWIATNKGLNIYNQNTEQFRLFDFNVNPQQTFLANQIRSLYEDENNIIWIGTHFGLFRHDPINNKTTHFEHLAINVIQGINRQQLLIGTIEHGLFVFDAKQQRFSLLNCADTDLSTTRITAVVKNRQNNFYIGTTDKGIFTYQPDTQQLVPSMIALPNQQVRAIAQENNGSIWVASLGGLHIFNAFDDKHPYSVQLSTQAASDDAENRVSGLYIGKNNNLWISTMGYGLFKFSARSRQFEYYVPSKAGDKGLQNRVVIHFAESPNGLIYIGKLSGNISVFNPQDKSFNHLELLRNGRPLARIITGIKLLSNEEILVSTHLGTFRVSTAVQTQEVTTSKQYDFLKGLSLVPGNQTTDIPFTLAYTDSQLLLLAMDSQDKLFIKHRIDYDLDIITGNNIQLVTSHYITDDHQIYITDVAGGIGKISHFLSGKPSLEIIRKRDHSYIDSVILDKDNNLWIGMEGSKLVVQPSKGEPWFFDGFNQYTTGFGSFAHDRVHNQLWLTTNRGMSSINLSDKSIYHYDELDGVEKYLDETGASLLAEDGTLYFGARNGFNRFNPKTVTPDLDAIAVRFTGFLLAGKQVVPGQGQGSVLNKSIISTKTIRLNYTQNAFGIEFSAVLAPFKKNITYAYQLDGYDTDWTYVSSQKRFANYTNIPAGEYVFRARAKNKNNVWSKHDSTVLIIISPPWYQTLPAYFFYVLLIVLMIYIIVKVRTVRLIKRAQELETSVSQRTTELAVEKKKVEQLLIKKDQEFANISHEFRTPLTLILGPTQQLIKKLTQAADVDQLNIIQRNGYRMLRMVDQLLNIETFKVDAITHKVTQHFAHSIKTIRLAFIPMAQNKNITIKIGKLDAVCSEFTQDAFEQILLNLVSNAIKYTEDGGNILISCVRTSDNQLKLSISDSGIGISAENQQAIFSRFVRVVDVKSQHVVGTGIGLALVKSLVEAHQGTIEVDSEVGKGTCITLCFPIIHEVDNKTTADKVNDELINKELKSIENQPNKNGLFIGKNESNENDALPSVLVIDDNVDMLNYITTNLATQHQVLSATNGREGLELAIQQVPDLIVSDVMMPEIDGYELADALRENVITAHIPIILLTAKGDTNSKLKGLNKQVDEYLTKPFDLQELKVRITNLLEIRKILQKRFAIALFNTDTSDSSNEGQKTEEQKFLTTLDEILNNVYTDMDLRVGLLADRLHISERQLFRKLKSIVDMSPTEYLRNFRLLKAVHLLKQGQRSTMVALEVGFSSASYFTKCFKAQYGKAPSEFFKRTED